MNTVILEGRNVRLRPLEVADAEITQKWRTGGRAFLLNKGAQTVEAQREWIAAEILTDNYNFIQELTAIGQAVGMLSVVDIHPVHRHAEIGHFLIGEPDAVRPYGPGKIAAEALRLIYDFVFYDLDLHSHWGPVASDNVAMIRWNEMLGTPSIGRLRDHYFLNGHWQDAVLFEMTRETYEQITVKKLRGLIGFDMEVPSGM